MIDRIEYEGYWYEYVHRLSSDDEICLATMDPEAYCNGTYSYSRKDPGNGMAFVITDTNEPVLKAMLILKKVQA